MNESNARKVRVELRLWGLSMRVTVRLTPGPTGAKSAVDDERLGMLADELQRVKERISELSAEADQSEVMARLPPGISSLKWPASMNTWTVTRYDAKRLGLSILTSIGIEPEMEEPAAP